MYVLIVKSESKTKDNLPRFRKVSKPATDKGVFVDHAPQSFLMMRSSKILEHFKTEAAKAQANSDANAGQSAFLDTAALAHLRYA